MEKLSISDLHIILVEPSDTQRKIITTLLLKENVKEILKAAKDNGCSIRIGVNSGSLEKN